MRSSAPTHNHLAYETMQYKTHIAMNISLDIRASMWLSYVLPAAISVVKYDKINRSLIVCFGAFILVVCTQGCMRFGSGCE